MGPSPSGQISKFPFVISNVFGQMCPKTSKFRTLVAQSHMQKWNYFKAFKNKAKAKVELERVKYNNPSQKKTS